MKGQYFSFDAIIASVIFVLALVALLSYWHSVRSFLDFQNDALSKDAIRVSNLLFGPAFPPESDCGDMELLGFARTWDDKRIDEPTLVCAEVWASDQQWLRNVTESSNNLSIRVELLTTGDEYIIGDEAPDGASNIVQIRRLATVVDEDGKTYLATVDTTVYK